MEIKMESLLEEYERISKENEEHRRIFGKYKDVTGGEYALGYDMIDGLPDGVEERGGIDAVYIECIQKKITWEELLNYHRKDNYSPDIFC